MISCVSKNLVSFLVIKAVSAILIELRAPTDYTIDYCYWVSLIFASSLISYLRDTDSFLGIF